MTDELGRGGQENILATVGSDDVCSLLFDRLIGANVLVSYVRDAVPESEKGKGDALREKRGVVQHMLDRVDLIPSNPPGVSLQFSDGSQFALTILKVTVPS